MNENPTDTSFGSDTATGQLLGHFPNHRPVSPNQLLRHADESLPISSDVSNESLLGKDVRFRLIPANCSDTEMSHRGFLQMYRMRTYREGCSFQTYQLSLDKSQPEISVFIVAVLIHNTVLTHWNCNSSFRLQHNRNNDQTRIIWRMDPPPSRWSTPVDPIVSTATATAATAAAAVAASIHGAPAAVWSRGVSAYWLRNTTTPVTPVSTPPM
jgi:hypothetical protein